MKRSRGLRLAVLGALALAACHPPPAGEEEEPLLFKLLVTQTGWVRVGQPALREAGLPPEVDPQRLALSCKGQRVAMRVAGSADGRFDAEDTLEFYAVAEDTALTGTGVYWLSMDADQPLRISATTESAAEQATLRDAYRATTTRQYRSVFTPSVQNGDVDNFFGPVVSDTGVGDDLPASNSRTDTVFASELMLILQGITLGEHQVAVGFNGVPLGDVTFYDQTSQHITLPIPSGVVVDGANSVELLRNSGAPNDIVLLDTLALSYPRSLLAVDNQLEFGAAPLSTVQVSGFTAAGLHAFDVTDVLQPREMPIQTDSGTVQFSVGEGEGRRFLVTAEGGGRGVSAIIPVHPTHWHGTEHEGELVIVTPSSFHAQLQPLVDLRQREGLSVSLVDLEDIYDEYGFGVKDEKTLKAFLNDARQHWLKPPRYVLLVGDASDDARNRLGMGDFDLLSTHSIATRYLETASDDWFVDADDDGVPELAIGRLPARTPAELETLLAKILAHRPKPLGTILDGVFVNDEPTGFAFEATSLTMATTVAARLSATQVVRGNQQTGLLPPMLDALSSGIQVLVYFGHGSTQQWAGEALSNETVPNLPVATELPIYLSMTCLNGYFQDAVTESLGEALVKTPGRGALAAWVSSGLTEPNQQAPMIDSALRYLLNQRLPLGEAVRLAKAETSDLDTRRTWLLLGDPTLRLWDVPWH